jgi:hypothetical protein
MSSLNFSLFVAARYSPFSILKKANPPDLRKILRMGNGRSRLLALLAYQMDKVELRGCPETNV